MSTLPDEAPASEEPRPASAAPLVVFIALVLLGMIAVGVAFARM